jgi:hypothetical protein
LARQLAGLLGNMMQEVVTYTGNQTDIPKFTSMINNLLAQDNFFIANARTFEYPVAATFYEGLANLTAKAYISWLEYKANDTSQSNSTTIGSTATTFASTTVVESTTAGSTTASATTAAGSTTQPSTTESTTQPSMFFRSSSAVGRKIIFFYIFIFRHNF